VNRQNLEPDAAIDSKRRPKILCGGDVQRFRDR
jgi:hypothetical protein